MIGTRHTLRIFTLSACLMMAQDLRGQRVEKPLPASVSDLQQGQVIEIRNDAGVTVLKGTFETKNDSKERKERKTKLSGISGSGWAEVEVSTKDGQVKEQELKLELERLLYGAPYKAFIDNKEVFAFSADEKGKVSLKLTSKNAK